MADMPDIIYSVLGLILILAGGLYLLGLVRDLCWRTVFKSEDTSSQIDLDAVRNDETEAISNSLDVRLIKTVLHGDSYSIPAYSVEVQGVFTVTRIINAKFVTSVFDTTEDEENLIPVLSVYEEFQQENSNAYQYSEEVGCTDVYNQGFRFTSWTRVGLVIPEIIQPPYGGARRLHVLLRLIDTLNQPHIGLGYNDPSDSGVIWQRGINIDSYHFSCKGYYEEAEQAGLRDEARTVAIQMGLAIAMSDGHLDDSEGNIIKEYIMKVISTFGENKRSELKNKYNNALKQGFSLIETGKITLNGLAFQMNRINPENRYKYEAVELCLDVMAADGIADAQELNAIRKIAESMNLDNSILEEMRDSKLVGLKSNITDEMSMEEILGIDKRWSIDEINMFLRDEFQKWNNRRNSLPEGDERDSAQDRIEMIAHVKKKYS